jgi:hypothetical protein
MASITERAWPLPQQHRLCRKIGGSDNKRMKYWSNNILKIHMPNSVDGWHHLCVLILSWQSQTMLASTAKAPQRWLKRPWGRAAKTQMVKGKTMPSPRPLQTKEQWDCVRGVSSKLTWKEGFFRTSIYVLEAGNNLGTTCWHGGAEKIAEKRVSRRHKAYTGGSWNTIPWYCWSHEQRRA